VFHEMSLQRRGRVKGLRVSRECEENFQFRFPKSQRQGFQKKLGILRNGMEGRKT